METKTHWKKQFNYNYIGAHTLTVGNDMVLTIKEMKQEEVAQLNGKKENCFTAHFAEANVKPMILNKTNCKIIEKLYGSFIEDWVGKKIQLYSAKVNAFGTETDALRVRNQIPGGKSEVQLLADLYLTKKDKMKLSDQRNAERIMKEKEVESYAKLKLELEKI